MGRAMKDSGVAWIGGVPRGWCVSRVKDVVSLFSGRSRGMPFYVGMENVESATGCLLAGKDARTSDDGLDGSFEKGDVLFGKLRPYLRKSWVADRSGSCSTEFLVLRSEKNFNNRFLFWNLLSEQFCSSVNDQCGGVKMPRADWGVVGNEIIPHPSVSEQRAIAAYLERETTLIDQEIALIERKVALLAEYRKAIIFEAVTKGLDKNATMKDSGVAWIGEAPSGWIVERAKNISRIATGKTPDTSNQDHFGGGIPWATIADLSENKKISSTKNTLSLLGVQSCGIKPCPKNSVLVSFKLSVGKAAIAESSIYTNEAIASFSPNSKILLGYLYWALPVFLLEVATENIYGAKILNQDKIRQAPVVLPPIPEQQAIAAYLERETALIDQEIALIERKAALLAEYRKALIFEAVTGKVEVPSL